MSINFLHFQFMDIHTTAKFKKMVEAGQVFGSEKKEDGQFLFSKVANNGNELNLHSLKSQSPPPSTFTFKVGVNSMSHTCNL